MKIWSKCTNPGSGLWVAGLAGGSMRSFGPSAAKAKYRLLLDLLRSRIAAELAATTSRDSLERLLLDGFEGLRRQNQDALVAKAREIGLAERDPRVEQLIHLLSESQLSRAIDTAARAAHEADPSARKRRATEALIEALKGEMVTPGMVTLALERSERLQQPPAAKASARAAMEVAAAALQ